MAPGGGPPDPALPDPLVRFLERLDRGEYWESHEALEGAWRARDSDFYRGLILYASAFVHVRRGNRHGIGAQLEKAEAALEPYAPSYLGLDVGGILEHAARCRRIVEEHPPGEDTDWEAVVPFPTLEADPRRIRGDEPELDPV